MNDCQAVALGERPPDLLVRGGRVLFPTKGTFEPRDVAVVGDRIATVPKNGSGLVSDKTTVVDATDRWVVPGFVDAHAHLDLHCAFERAYPHVLAGGTTTVVTESSSFGSAFGSAGVRQFLAATADLPVDVRMTVPPQSLLDTFEPASADDAETDALCDLLADDRVVGVGETGWIHVVGRDVPADVLYERARAEGKPIAGHGAGCSGEKLAAFASVVDDDHESITGEQVLERLENGLHAIGRSGSIRDDARAIADACEQVGAADLSLSTDGMWPPDLLERGYVDEVLRRTTAAGVEPVDALRMATYNPARHFGLDDRGAIAPGQRADLVVLDDLEDVRVGTVLSRGEVVVEDGEPAVDPKPYEYPDWFRSPVTVEVDGRPFHVSPEVAVDGRVRAIENREGLLTAETTVEPPVVEGNIAPDPDADLCKVALIDRRPGTGDSEFTGFMTGLGLRAGAAASTLTWELPGLVVVGTDDTEMQAAVDRVSAMGGGWAVVRDGEVLADLPTPVGGVAADHPIGEVATRVEAIEDALQSLGADLPNAALSIQTLTFSGVPALKLSFSGYADVFRREIVGLAPD